MGKRFNVEDLLVGLRMTANSLEGSVSLQGQQVESYQLRSSLLDAPVGAEIVQLDFWPDGLEDREVYKKVGFFEWERLD